MHGDICKHLGKDSSTDRMIGNQPVLEYGFFHLFIPPTDKVRGYSDQPGVRPSVDKSLCPQ